MNWTEFQRQHAEWIARMFPGQKPLLPAACLVEECGELVQALCKRQQELQWGAEQRWAGVDWYVKLVDAIGDIAIAACSLCNAADWDFDAVMNSACTTAVYNLSPIAIAALVTSAASSALFHVSQGRFEDARMQLSICLAHLCTVAEHANLTLVDAVEMTWQELRQRRRH